MLVRAITDSETLIPSLTSPNDRACMSETLTRAQLALQAERTQLFMETSDLYGWDPYDALLSPIFRLPLLRSRWLPRFVGQQLVLRSPINLRGLLRVPRQRNPVTIGLYVQGLSDLVSGNLLDREAAATEVERCVNDLKRSASQEYSGPCWGYPFPWEGRRHRMPAGTPTIVATGMVVAGLHRAWSVFGNEDARRLVRESAAFVLEDLPHAAGDDASWCWAYSPKDRQVVLNATMKGTRLLSHALDAGLDDDHALFAACASARFTAERQEKNGGWPYATGNDPRTWRDHHHTGYVLECFNTYRQLCGDNRFDETIERGWRHYRRDFFDDAGLPLYYDDREGPTDATAAGQALITLSAFGDREFGSKVAAASIDALANFDGSFAYRRNKDRLTRTHFMRWSTAWMFAGMARLLAEVP